jgi:DNA-binding transcriptional ArsR family regulator
LKKSRARALEETDAVFAALSHPSRRQILLTLQFRGGKMTSGEIADRFSCRWPTTIRHLRVLEAARLVRVEKRGRERIYHLERRRLLRVSAEWFRWFEANEKGEKP